jgi:pSer/pThr/pTyr-binding forkhead associated (FHA) protein
MPTLTLKFKNNSLGEYQLQKGVSFTIGRRKTNDVVIEDPAVSGHHAKIDAVGDRFVLTDLQSKNGSFVNEQLIHSHWLKHEDVIAIGGHVLVFNNPENEQTRQADVPEFDETLALNTTQRRRMMIKSNPTKSINVVRFWDKGQNRGVVRENVPPVPKARSASRKRQPAGALNYLAGGRGQIKLTRKITTIGKDPTSDVLVKGLLMNPTAATISKRPDGFWFNYIGGLPKPRINAKPVKKATLLNDLDIIELGSTRLQFSIESPAT